MASGYIFSVVISNEYLGVSRTIKAQSEWELDLKANEQLRKWNEQASRKWEAENKRARIQLNKEMIASLQNEAELENEKAQQQIQLYNSILSVSLSRNDAFDGNHTRRDNYKAFVYDKQAPTTL